eukprot:6924213-Karenia_brevis.AAC.1
MERKALMFNVINFGGAVSVSEKREQWQCVAPLLCGTRGQGLQFDVISFYAAISACVIGRQRQRV